MAVKIFWLFSIRYHPGVTKSSQLITESLRKKICQLGVGSISCISYFVPVIDMKKWTSTWILSLLQTVCLFSLPFLILGHQYLVPWKSLLSCWNLIFCILLPSYTASLGWLIILLFDKILVTLLKSMQQQWYFCAFWCCLRKSNSVCDIWTKKRVQ